MYASMYLPKMSTQGVRSEGGRDNIRIDIRSSRAVRRVAPNVNLIGVLVHAHIVDAHLRWERQVLKVHEAERARDTQVREDVLPYGACVRCEACNQAGEERTMGSSGTGRAAISTSRSGPTAFEVSVHANLLSLIQEMYCGTISIPTKPMGGR